MSKVTKLETYRNRSTNEECQFITVSIPDPTVVGGGYAGDAFHTVTQSLIRMQSVAGIVYTRSDEFLALYFNGKQTCATPVDTFFREFERVEDTNELL